MGILADRESLLLIDGKLVAGSGGTFPTVNPATEEVLGVAADADVEDMGRAVEAARRAFDETDWSTNTELRVRCLRQLQRRPARARRGIAGVDDCRGGCAADADRRRAAGGSDRRPGVLRRPPPRSYNWRTDLGVASPQGIPTRRTIAREAVGVVGAITPWNFPHQINLAKLGPALAAGNTVVLKPAPDTPWCAAAVGQIIAEHTDFPPGVVNIVTSSDHGVGALLSKDPRVDMVSFTGSTATGRGRDDGRGRDHQEGLPRTRRQVGVPRPRRRGSRRRLLDVRVHRGDARRAGLRDHHPAGGAPRPLRRSGRGRRGHHGIRSSPATRPTSARCAVR